MSLPIVLLHGVRLSGSMWHLVRDRLTADGRTVLTPDLPGHGTRRDERLTLDAAVDAVSQSIDAAGGRVLLGGLSLGGYVAMAVAARHSSKVAGLVGFGCTAKVAGLGLTSYRAAGRYATRHPGRVARASTRALRAVLPAEAATAALAGGLACESIGAAVEAVAAAGDPEILRSYDGPVWFVNGSRDLFRSHERDFLAACRDGRLIVVPGVGHVGVLARPDTLAGIARDAATVAEARLPVS